MSCIAAVADLYRFLDLSLDSSQNQLLLFRLPSMQMRSLLLHQSARRNRCCCINLPDAKDNESNDGQELMAQQSDAFECSRYYGQRKPARCRHTLTGTTSMH